jgi:hypothetical protein
VIDFILENNRLFFKLKKQEMIKKLFIVHKADSSFIDYNFYCYKYDGRNKENIEIPAFIPIMTLINIKIES